jgi:beta-fructofuranosidase
MNDRRALQAAMEALREAIPRAQADPSRPVFHFCPPALWMNDINGPLFHKGYYHIFYQHNPFGDMPMGERLAHMHWGHARSKNLVDWEHLPIALAPSHERGEKSCWSGCSAIDGNGRPTILYTSVFEDHLPFTKPFEQWAAFGDETLTHWEKNPRNPVLSFSEHGAPGIHPEWRDPFIFSAAGRTFLILGACGEAGIPIYESQDLALTQWKHVGRLLNENVECPHFFPLGDRWIFISSPFGAVRYSAGPFEPSTLTFLPETCGVVDGGHYYGASVLHDERGRCILLGWIPGWNWECFQSGRGWNGCMSLPRVLTLSPAKRLLQSPISELKRLRAGAHVREAALEVEEVPCSFGTVCDTCEILMEIFSAAEEWGMRLRSSEDSLFIRCNHREKCLTVSGAKVPLSADGLERMKLHIFIDKSVIEVYVNEGEAVASSMESKALGERNMEFFSHGGKLQLKSLDIWKLSPAEFGASSSHI